MKYFYPYGLYIYIKYIYINEVLDLRLVNGKVLLEAPIIMGIHSHIIKDIFTTRKERKRT